MKLRNIIWVCLLAFVLSGVQANAQFEDPRVLGGEKIRDLEPIFPNQEEVRPSGVKSAQSGFVFLAFSTDARRAAMADAGAGLIGDASGALFLNPGLLGFVFDLISMAGRTPTPHHLNLATEIDSPIDFDERTLVGLEYRFKHATSAMGFALRGGYKHNHDLEDYSFGGGIDYKTEAGKGVRIDYAFKHFNTSFADPVQMVSAAISF